MGDPGLHKSPCTVHLVRRRADGAWRPWQPVQPVASAPRADGSVCGRGMKRLLAIALGGALFAWAAFPAPEKLADPEMEARAVALQKQLRCLVCEGESLDESNAPLAADLRRLIRERIAAGDTNEQVQRYLVARYGDFVLMKPPLKPDTYIL